MSETGSPTIAPDANDVFVLTAKGVRERHKAADIRGHDFRQSGFLTPSELRRIRQRHEQLVRALAARLAMFLRLEFTLQLSKVQIVGYQKFIEDLPSPTHITLFKTDPLKGVGLLVIPPKVGLTFVDRLLGGPGQMPSEGRDLSEIEIALIDQIATLIFSEWCNHWPEMRGLHPSLLGHENNSRFLQTATPDTAMLILTMTGGIGEQAEPMQIVFPYATVEPLMRLLSPVIARLGSGSRARGETKMESGIRRGQSSRHRRMAGIENVRRRHHAAQDRRFAALDPACAAQVQLSLNQVPKFIGRPGTSSGKWAVQLTSNITSNNLT
jgi:flagellar motor switch protein FliM